MRLWLISYDIVDDRRRRAVEKLLQARGERVNFSVFECFLNATAFHALYSDLIGHVDQVADSLRCYPLCSWCEQRISLQGKGRKHNHPNDWIV